MLFKPLKVEREVVLEIVQGESPQLNKFRRLVDLNKNKFKYYPLKGKPINKNELENIYNNTAFETTLLLIDIHDISYGIFVEIINQSLFHNLDYCLLFEDTVMAGNNIAFPYYNCGNTSPRRCNLFLSNSFIPQKRVENEQNRMPQKRYFILYILIFGMFFFYSILPFIRSKIFSK